MYNNVLNAFRWLFFVVVVCIFIFFSCLISKTTWSNKETKRYRIDSRDECGQGKLLRYVIVEEKEYSCQKFITLHDTCDINDAIRIQKELNLQLKIVK